MVHFSRLFEKRNKDCLEQTKQSTPLAYPFSAFVLSQKDYYLRVNKLEPYFFQPGFTTHGYP